MLLDIITPTLNAGHYLPFCIQNVQLIKDPEVKFLIVDSGSIDNTMDIIEKFKVRHIYSPPGNMYQAVNLGIHCGDSEWVSYINSDDILFPNALLEAFNRHSLHCDVIYGNIDFIDSDGCFLHCWRSLNPKELAGSFGNTIMPIPQPGTLIRRSLWEKLGGFDENYKYSSDFDFFLRAFISGAKFGYFDGPSMAAFRVHGKQISQNNAANMASESKTSLSFSGLDVSILKKVISIFKMRYRNLYCYLIRLLRYRFISRSWRVTKSIDSYDS